MSPEDTGPRFESPMEPEGAGNTSDQLPVQAYARPKKKKQRSPLRNFLEFIAIFLGAVIVAYVLQAYLVKPFQIPSASMEPTIDPGDRILVNRLAYRYGEIQRGDVIVFKSPTEAGVDFVKRVIALPGDTVEVNRGEVILNGEPQDEPYISARDASIFPEQTVPDGSVFVLGDNRSDSQDSRYWRVPWLPQENILGKAFFIYWPPGRFSGF